MRPVRVPNWMRGFYDDFHDNKESHHDALKPHEAPEHHQRRDEMEAIERSHHERGIGRAEH